MERLAVVARLRADTELQAASLIAAGPPFDPGEVGLERHDVYLSHGEVVFVFEGPQVEWIVDALVDDPFRSPVFASWEPLLDGPARLARPAFHWQRAGPPA